MGVAGRASRLESRQMALLNCQAELFGAISRPALVNTAGLPRTRILAPKHGLLRQPGLAINTTPQPPWERFMKEW